MNCRPRFIAVSALAAILPLLSGADTELPATTNRTNRAQAKSVSTNAVAAAQPPAAAKPAPKRKIDIDLLRMSKTIREAWSYRLVENPMPFNGKIIQICGDFYAFDPEDEKKRRFCCALKDPAGCCDIGEIEFSLRGEHQWPKDFPEEFTRITVNGKVEVVRDGSGQPFIKLTEADLVRTPAK